MDIIADEILQLVKIKMEEQAAYNRDAYQELIEETIQYFHERGKLTDEDNDEFIVSQLMEIWDEVEEEFARKKI